MTTSYFRLSRLVISVALAAALSFTLWNAVYIANHDYHYYGTNNDHHLLSPPAMEQRGTLPLDCTAFLRNLSLHQAAVEDPNDGRMYSRLTVTEPPFWTSVHYRDYDKTRFAIFDHGWYYEKVLTAAFQEVLMDNTTKSHQNVRVLDVGGNIGWFTLLSASMGYHVDVFEPNLINGIRICQSIHLNGWKSNIRESWIRPGQSSVNYYHNGVGHVESVLEMYIPPEGINPGQGSFVIPGHAQKSTTTKVPVIRLDQLAEDKGWFLSRPHIAVLKVDVEGFEAKVFHGASKLLQSGMIYNIFMEAGKSDNVTELSFLYRQIIEAGYRLHATGSWSGPGNLYRKPTSPQVTIPYITNVLIPNTPASVNLWWKKKKNETNSS